MNNSNNYPGRLFEDDCTVGKAECLEEDLLDIDSLIELRREKFHKEWEEYLSEWDYYN